LLSRRTSEAAIGLPGSHRRRSTASSKRRRSSRRSSQGQAGQRRDSLSQMLSEEGRRGAWVKNALSVVLICVAGAAGWAAAWKSGAWHPAPAEEIGGDTPLGAEVLGYVSAVCYLGYVSFYTDRMCGGSLADWG